MSPRARSASASLLLVLALTVGFAAVGGTTAPPARGQESEPAWGVLDSTCAPDRRDTEAQEGVTVVEVEASWSGYQPTAATVDPNYVAALRARVDDCLAAGFRVVLGSGVQYAPDWVRSLPGAVLRDQRGKAPASGAVDIVFSQSVRDAEAGYLRRLVADLPSARLDGIRIGTSSRGEIGYPGPEESGDGFLQSWWAFDPAAQQGTGLAAGQPAGPMPGWVPGQGTWQGRTVTPADAENWFGWYERALARTVYWQVQTLRAAGFAGEVHLPSPGTGVLPADLGVATGALLGGAGDRDGSLGRGLYYVDQFPLLAQALVGAGPLVVDLTSVDDGSAPPARAQDPPTDMCTDSDAATSVQAGTPVGTWSALRFARAQAARAGLGAIGENAGPPAPQTGGASTSDSERDQIRWSPTYARGCHLATFLLAFEEDLFTSRSGTRFQDYVDAVRGPAPSRTAAATPAASP